MQKINLNFFIFSIVFLLLSLCSIESFTQVPHTVYGNLQYSNNEIPDSINFNAYIKTRPSDSLTASSDNCGYYQTSGQWYIQCAEFNSAWYPGDYLIIKFNDDKISSAADTVRLSSQPYDSAGTTTLYKPFHQILIKTSPSGLDYTVDGKTYNNSKNFRWEQESSHIILLDSVQFKEDMIKNIFISWSNGGEHNQNYIVGNTDDTLKASFETKYLLELNSSHGNPQGEGWYDIHDNVRVSIDSRDIEQNNKYLFTNWSGDKYSTDTSLVISMDTPKSLTANWDIEHYLTINSSYGNPRGQGWYSKNSWASFSVTTPDVKGKTKYIFQNWTGDYTGQSSNASILMDTSKTINAEWNTQYYLTLGKNPVTGGNTTPSPPGLWVDETQEIQLSASPAVNYLFSEWNGDIETNENPTSINMTKPMDITAEFLKIVDVTIRTTPSNQIIIVDDVEYTAPQSFEWVEKTIHTISVKSPVYTVKDTRYIFDSWSNGAEKTQMYMVSNQNEILTCSLKKQYHLTVDSEHGYPKGTGWYDANSYVDFSVTDPDLQGGTRYLFTGWSGDYSASKPSGSIYMNSPKTIHASWKTQYYLTVRNSGHGEVTGEGWYDNGQTAVFSVKMAVVPEEELTRYIFSGWEGTGTGSYSGDDQSHTLVMNHPIIEKVKWTLQYFLSTQVNPVNGGDIDPAPPGNWYNENAEAKINALPADSYKFLFWTGDVLGTNNPTTKKITSPTSATAHFSRIIEVTINTNPTGLTFYADKEKYTAPQTFSWAENTTHIITADSLNQVDSGIRYEYNQWSDGGSREHIFTVPENNTAITADYNLQYYLTIDSDYGTPQGEGWYYQDTKAGFSVDELDIQGFTKKMFNRWTGDFSGHSNTDSIIINQPTTITAVWDTEYFIELISDYGTTSGQGWYPEGSQVNFSVTPIVQTLGDTIKHTFIKWRGTGNGSYTGNNNSHTVILNNPMIEKALWETKYFLSTNTEPENTGYIDPAPPGDWFIKNSVVDISATPKDNYYFSHWSGDIEDEINPTSVTMDSPKHIKAIFGSKTGITIDTNPTGLKFTADNIEYTAPQTFMWTQHTSHTVSVHSPQDPDDLHHYEFTSWSNGNPREHTYTVPTIQDTLTANFQTYYFLEISSTYGSPKGSGWYTKESLAQISINKHIDLNPDDQSRKVFHKWEGDYYGTDTLASIYMNTPKIITTNWETQYYVDVISERGTTSGGGWYTQNTSATIGVNSPIYSNSTMRYSFSKWQGTGEGSYTGNSRSVSIPVKNPITETVVWAKEYLVQTSVNPEWGGTIKFTPPGNWHKVDTNVYATAVPDTANNYIFASWSGDLVSATNPETLFVDNPKIITANFNTAEKTLITTEPSGLPITVDGNDHVSPKYFYWPYGTTHSISVSKKYKPNNDTQYIFQYWNDQGDTTHTINVGDQSSYRAVFKTQYFLHTQVNPSDGGTLSPSVPGSWFNQGVEVTINANPSEGYIFAYWTGNINTTKNPVSTTMDKSKSVIAHFDKSTGIQENPDTPDKFLLKQNYPNPFNPETTIEYQIPVSGYINLRICNTQGQTLRILLDKYQVAGTHKISWDGKDDWGNLVSSGIYYYILKNDNTIKIKKLLFLK
ncbi:MAG: T9SS type A sorting domain-containing protein [bacterium]